MKMCSLFDGSGGFCLAAVLNGIIPVECSEVEPFPIRVTSRRMPWVKHLGDVSKINGAEIEPVDIITFGSPCQDLSIAGKRAGLQEGDRSNLFFQAIRIVKEMRKATNGIYPRFAVWENVPGAFSSNKGEDFRMVLQEFCQVKEAVDVPRPEKWHNAGEIGGGGYSIAWRVFDAQFWGVPQRRKRIYLVADFNGECAGEILFEQDGVSRNFTQGCFEGQRVTPVAQKSIEATIVAKGPSAVGQPLYCLSKESHFTSPAKDIACTLAATDYKCAQATCVPQKGVSYMGNGSNVAEPDYIVRRLTPTEYAKLQGFPTWWCSDLETPHPTDEEIAEWRERFITHARIVGKSVKPKSDNQIRKWLQNPHSDSAEYKMWGNGIALPCASFIMAGLKKYDKEKNE